MKCLAFTSPCDKLSLIMCVPFPWLWLHRAMAVGSPPTRKRKNVRENKQELKAWSN